MLTKSDFLIYTEAPLHLWAKKNNQYKKEFSQYDTHLAKQGYEVEALAREYARRYLSKDAEFQKEFKYENLLSKADIVVGNSIYEVKSGTNIDKENKYDVLFQYYVASKSSDIENIYILHLNKEYERKGEIQLDELFVIEDMTEYVKENLDIVEGLIAEALIIEGKDTPQGLVECHRPKECPCINLCHPNLPQYSIYDIANAKEAKLRVLRDMGILDIKDVPSDFKLSKMQKKQIEVAKSEGPYINKEMIEGDIGELEYPIHFLDYETYSWAIPQYENHKPYQNVVFQYSLHMLEKDGEMSHKEFLSTTKDDPIKEVIENLKVDMKDEGSILVWNKKFEMGCNKEMGRIYPEEAGFLEELNSRVYDLGDIFSKQMYIDSQFKGSWSIKKVLPVLVPTLTYKDMEISNGTEAMVGWETLVYKNIPEEERIQLLNDMLKYCKLDTYAMYEIYRYLLTLF
ncbi:MAG: DUF2779 domain-containing protein [Candidatus Dojkabacteria bacterium]